MAGDTWRLELDGQSAPFRMVCRWKGKSSELSFFSAATSRVAAAACPVSRLHDCWCAEQATMNVPLFYYGFHSAVQ